MTASEAMRFRDGIGEFFSKISKMSVPRDTFFLERHALPIKTSMRGVCRLTMRAECAHTAASVA